MAAAAAKAGRAAFSPSVRLRSMCRNFCLSVIYDLPLTKLDGAPRKAPPRRRG